MDTNHWTVDELGIYQRLLLTEWVNGGIPDNEERLARIAGCSLKKFKKAWPTVRVKFQNGHFWESKSGSSISIDATLLGTPYLINPKMEEVRKNQLKYSESRRKNVSVRYKDKPTYEPTHEEHSLYIDPALQSSSSSSNKKKKNILSDDEFLKSLKEKFTWVDFDREMAKIDAWLLANPGRQKTRRFIVKWISRVEKPMEIKGKW